MISPLTRNESKIPPRTGGSQLITGAQIKLGRLILGWGRKRLAYESGISLATIFRAEAQEYPPITFRSLHAIAKTLAEHGVTFIEADDTGGPGVRFNQPGNGQ